MGLQKGASGQDKCSNRIPRCVRGPQCLRVCLSVCLCVCVRGAWMCLSAPDAFLLGLLVFHYNPLAVDLFLDERALAFWTYLIVINDTNVWQGKSYYYNFNPVSSSDVHILNKLFFWITSHFSRSAVFNLMPSRPAPFSHQREKLLSYLTEKGQQRRKLEKEKPWHHLFQSTKKCLVRHGLAPFSAPPPAPLTQ